MIKKITKKKFFAFAALLLSIGMQAQNVTLQYGQSVGGDSEHGELARGMVTDDNGNIYITGIFHDTVDFDPSEGTTQLTSTGDDDVFIAKYDANGNLVWAHNILLFAETNTSGEERPTAIAIDENNNLYVTGESSIGLAGYFVSKWDTNGTKIWTKSLFTDNFENDITPFDIEASGGVVKIVGRTAGTNDFDFLETETHNNTTNAVDGFIHAIDYDGNFLWVKDLQSSLRSEFTGIATDSDGNIFVTGAFTGAIDTDFSQETNILSTSVPDPDVSAGFLIKYSPDGELIWNRLLLNMDDSSVVFNTLTTDTEDNVILTGSIIGTIQIINNGEVETVFTNIANFGTYITKFSSVGDLSWTYHISGTESNFNLPFDVATDECNTIYISGEFRGICDFDTSDSDFIMSSQSFSKDDVYVAVFSDEGSLSGAFQIGGTGNPEFLDLNSHMPITVKNNSLTIAGTYVGGLDLDPSSGTTEVVSVNQAGTSIPSRDFFIAKYTLNTGCILSLNDYKEANTFTISPNPAHESFTITLGNDYNGYDIYIYDVTGKCVLQKTNLSGITNTININNLTSGLYLVKLQTGEKTTSKKVLVN